MSDGARACGRAQTRGKAPMCESRLGSSAQVVVTVKICRRGGRPEAQRSRYGKAPLRAEGAAGDRSEELRGGAGTLWQCQASGCAKGWRCTVRSLLCRPRLASSLSAPDTETSDDGAATARGTSRWSVKGGNRAALQGGKQGCIVVQQRTTALCDGWPPMLQAKHRGPDRNSTRL